ncbi:MAG: prophage regulatory protein [Comamonadaceae bacterium]|nr:MAG: prophage regulatory protein [Comamonadaceae bacterium]
MKPVPRKSKLAAIHMAQTALGMDEYSARAVKTNVIGKSSCGDMTDKELSKYLAHLSRLQKQVGGSKPARTQRPALHRSIDDDQDARWHKARALWSALAKAGVVRLDSDDALSAWVKRQTKVESWRFLNTHQINNLVIEPLKKWCVEKGVSIDPAT